jgi:disulfide oxidoreductase YuzD
LENIYAENDDFKCFNDKMGKFKKKRKQSQFSQYSPPTLSVKMRFMNYIPFLEWANIMLTNFKKIPTEIVEELGFLQELKPFIKELTDVFFLGQQIGILLKKQGICPMTKQKTMEMTAILSKKYAKNPRVMTLIKAIDDYFETTLAIYIKCAKKEEAMPPLYKPIIASSEIIESIFGKFKHRSLKDPKRGFSAIALIIPLFCWKFSPFDVFKAMTTISTKDIEKWENENLTKKGYKSFRNVFKKKTKKRGTLKKAA